MAEMGIKERLILYFKTNYKRILIRTGITLAAVFISFLLLDVIFPLPPPKPYSRIVLDKDGQLLSAFLSEDDHWRMPTKLYEVNPDLVDALTYKEDRWFRWHLGVNPFAIARAAIGNLISGKRSSGASTITMQVARMLEPKERTFWSKIKEMFRAFQLEWHYDKDEILEMYLSYLPYGGNVEGVKAASHIFFERPPSTLSLSQATLLAVIPNRPNSLRLDLHPDAAQASRDEWLKRFEEGGLFSPNIIQAAITEPVRGRRVPVKVGAPHLSRRLLNRTAALVVHSTIDPKIQNLAETLLREYVRRARPKGISNGAVVVVDNINASVRAYCGSADFHDAAAYGEVDGVRAVRSPGSTLKPLAYGMALDKGKLSPDTRMIDVPSDWNGYSPDNFDETFQGPVTMAAALRQSLNIPAVAALQLAGFEDFIDRLQAAGFQTVKRQRKQLGLSVILGGCGATLEELTGLFASYASGGMYRRLSLTQDEALQPKLPVQILSPESAWLIGDILSGIERPDIPNELLSRSGRAKVSWKTGTSYGHKDAWSIGFTPRYTIGVWIGNFDGRGAIDLSGATMAVPLLFDLFNAIEQKSSDQYRFQPWQVQKREVCAETGDLPGPECSKKRMGYYIKQVSPRRICDQEKLIYVSEDSSVQYCTGCLPPTGFLRASYPILPAKLSIWYENQGILYLKPPPHNKACEAAFDGPGPQIQSPSADYEYLVENGANQEILLQAASDGFVSQHYWYINGDFYRSCKPGERIFFAPKAGKSEITCMDDHGRSTSVTIQVKAY